MANPFARMAKAATSRERTRRALTADELVRLVDAARRRPVAELGRPTVRLPKRDGATTRRGCWTRAELTPDNLGECEARAYALRDEAEGDKRTRLAERIAEAEREGRRRALLWKCFALTGLRRGELASLTVADAKLDGPAPVLVLRAENEKSRRGAEIPLRGDLAADLAQHLAERLRVQQAQAKAASRPLPARLDGAEALLEVPGDLLRMLERDAAAAGLAKHDAERGAVCVHGFRHTLATLLAVAGIPLTTRRLLMRHAAAGLTDGDYMDTALIDTRGALDVLPALPLDGDTRERHRATGTTDAAPVCAPVCRNPDLLGLCLGTAGNSGRPSIFPRAAVSGDDGNTCAPLGIGGEKRATGFEPATFSLEG
ncbi:MAG: site-specific integrase [Phycisphaerales bacterium]|nr:site-specific integrase [Phycisphaerales bacterium]